MKKKIFIIGLIVILAIIMLVILIENGNKEQENKESSKTNASQSEESIEEWKNVITKFMQACEEKDIDKVEETVDLIGFVYMYEGSGVINGQPGTIFPTSNFDASYENLIENSSDTNNTDETEMIDVVKKGTINSSEFESYDITNFSDLEKLDDSEKLYKTIVTLDDGEIYDFYLINEDTYKIVGVGYDAESPSQVNSVAETEKNVFNSQFTAYEGENVRGASVKSLLNKIISVNESSNLTSVFVQYDSQTISSDNAEKINEFKNSISNSKTYKVSFEYDDNGLINKIIIE